MFTRCWGAVDEPPLPPLEVVQLGATVAARRIEPTIAECRMLNFQVKTATRRFLTSPIDIQHSAFFGSIAWSFSDRPSCTTPLCKGIVQLSSPDELIA